MHINLPVAVFCLRLRLFYTSCRQDRKGLRVLAAPGCRYRDCDDKRNGDKAFDGDNQREEPVRHTGRAAVFQRSGRKYGRVGYLRGSALLNHYGKGHAAFEVIAQTEVHGVSAGRPCRDVVKVCRLTRGIGYGKRVLAFLDAVLRKIVVDGVLHARVFSVHDFQRARLRRLHKVRRPRAWIP